MGIELILDMAGGALGERVTPGRRTGGLTFAVLDKGRRGRGGAAGCLGCSQRGPRRA